jgi:hypothetical protein
MVFVNEPGRVEHLQGICQDKRYKDEALIDLTDGRAEWRETLAYVESLFG